MLFQQNLRIAQQDRNLQGSDVFVAQDGLVVIEAESVPIVAPWKLQTNITGYTGTGYLQFDGNTVSGGNPLGRLSYKFKIDVPGTYHLRMRARKIGTTTSNDCYTRMVGHPGFRGDSDVRSALTGQVKPNIWATRLDHIYGNPRVFETPAYNLTSAGIYELQVSGRTKFFMFDRLMLFHVGLVTDFYAREDARTESPRLVVGSTPAPVPISPSAPVASPTTLSPVVQPRLPKIFFYLVTAGGPVDGVIKELQSGEKVSQSVVGTSLSIQVTAPEVATISKVTFYYGVPNPTSQVETTPPYLMGGDVGTKFSAVNYLKTVGKKTIGSKVYDSRGAVVAEQEIIIDIVA